MSRQIGQVHIDTFKAFLTSGEDLPKSRDGSVNITRLSDITGIPKSSFYQNQTIRELLDSVDGPRDQRPSSTLEETGTADAEASHAARDSKKIQGLERRIHDLEQHNAVLVAGNSELRRQIKDLRLQLGRQDMIIDSGRRVTSPPAET